MPVVYNILTVLCVFYITSIYVLFDLYKPSTYSPYMFNRTFLYFYLLSIISNFPSPSAILERIAEFVTSFLLLYLEQTSQFSREFTNHMPLKML